MKAYEQPVQKISGALFMARLDPACRDLFGESIIEVMRSINSGRRGFVDDVTPEDDLVHEIESVLGHELKELEAYDLAEGVDTHLTSIGEIIAHVENKGFGTGGVVSRDAFLTRLNQVRDGLRAEHTRLVEEANEVVTSADGWGS